MWNKTQRLYRTRFRKRRRLRSGMHHETRTQLCCESREITTCLVNSARSRNLNHRRHVRLHDWIVSILAFSADREIVLQREIDSLHGSPTYLHRAQRRWVHRIHRSRNPLIAASDKNSIRTDYDTPSHKKTSRSILWLELWRLRTHARRRHHSTRRHESHGMPNLPQEQNRRSRRNNAWIRNRRVHAILVPSTSINTTTSTRVRASLIHRISLQHESPSRRFPSWHHN